MNISDHKLRLIFGRKGCGKSSTLASLASKGISRHQYVYSNVDMTFTDEHFIHIDLEEFGKFKPEPDSLILLDEINNLWDNRSFKNFEKSTQQFFRYQRHFKCTIILFSQTYDCDVKIKNLADELYIAKKFFGYFTCLKRVDKFIYVTSPDESHGASDIVEAYEMTKFFMPGARSWVFLPKWWKYYDSYSLYDLPDLNHLREEKKKKGTILL